MSNLVTSAVRHNAKWGSFRLVSPEFRSAEVET